MGLWGLDCVMLPAAELYKQIWEYDARTLYDDPRAHLAVSLITAVVLQPLVQAL